MLQVLQFKCFSSGMLQVVHMDVAKVDQNIASISEAYCKPLFKMFHLFQTMLQVFFIWMLHIFHTYVARVYSKCCGCFSLMLQ
jgi:hypothetical protein